MSLDEQDFRRRLLAVAESGENFRQRVLSPAEVALLDYCSQNREAPDYVAMVAHEALNKALETGHHAIALRLLQTSGIHAHIRAQNDILAKTIGAHTICGYSIHYSTEILALLHALLHSGADPDGADCEGRSALLQVCQQGFTQGFHLLFNATRSPCRYAESGQSLIVGYTGRPETHVCKLVKATLMALPSPECHAYDEAASQFGGYDQIIRELHKHHHIIPVNSPYVLQHFHLLCFYGYTDRAREVLDMGIDLHRAGEKKVSVWKVFGCALEAATAGGQRKIIVELLERGANPQQMLILEKRHSAQRQSIIQAAVRSPLRRSPRDLWRSKTHFSVLDACECLLDQSSCDYDLEVLLAACSLNGDTKTLERILRCRRGSRRPLMAVREAASVDVITLLSRYWVLIDAEAMFKYAVRNKAFQIVQYLLQAGLKTIHVGELRDFLEDVHLARAASIEMVRQIMSCFPHQYETVFPDQSEIDGKTTVLRLSVKQKWVDTIKFLLDNGASMECPDFNDGILDYYYSDLRRVLTGPVIPTSKLRNQNMILLLAEHSSESTLARVREELMPDFRELVEDLQSIRPRYDIASMPSSNIVGSLSEMIVDDFTLGSSEGDLASTDTKTLLTSMEDTVCHRRPLFEYTTLKRRTQIRLIEILPSTEISSIIQTSIAEVDLGHVVEYEALSYCWGMPDFTRVIWLNEARFLVSENLHQALHRLRPIHTPRRLWIDAICINQEDDSEKSHQVSLMREIYRHAQKTVVWVGEHADNSELIFDHIQKWRDWCTDFHAGKVRDEEEMQRRDNVDLYEGETERAFEEFCRRPYFWRTWILQELALAKDIVICCGNRCERLSLVANRYAPNRDGAGTRCHSLRGTEPIDHMIGIRELKAGYRSTDLPELIGFSRFCKASDPRDKIYGLLGMFEDHLVEADYGMAATEIYCDFTRWAMRRLNSIIPLHWTGTENKSLTLPSWVPDYSIIGELGVLQKVHSSWSIPRVSGICIDFEGQDLKTRGKCFDRILAIGSTLRLPEKAGDDTFLQCFAEWEMIASVHMDGSDATKQFNDFGAAITGCDRYRDHNGFFESSGPLTGGAFLFALWYMAFGQGPIKAACKNLFDVLDIVIFLTAHMHFDFSDTEFENFADSVERACYGRRFFVSANGCMGLAPPEAQEGDPIVFFPSGHYAFVMHQYPSDDGAGKWRIIGDCSLNDLDIESLFSDSNEIPMDDFVIC